MTTKRRLVLLVLLPFACASPDTSGAVPAVITSVGPEIVRGTESDASQNGVVLVMHYDAIGKGGGAASGCTGSLLAPRLVLTARHCVADTDPGAACNAKGEAVSGGAILKDHEPSALYVFGGKDRPDFLAGTARPSKGQEILTTGAKTLCNNDIALILLDRPVYGAVIVPIKLDAKPLAGEKVTVVGWGIAEDEPNPPTRRQKANVAVLDVGPHEDLGPAEFRAGEGTCQGDSGGPAIAASGAVLGALSRGGNDKGGSGADGCIDAENIFTSVATHADFVRAGYEKAGQEPWLEGKPNPTLAKSGAACAADAECQSSFCDGTRKVCADDCTHAACAEGFRCERSTGSRDICVADPKADDGCSVVSPHAPSPLPALSALAVLLACVRRKKRVTTTG